MLHARWDAVEAYLKSYIEAYMEGVKANKTDASGLPSFCKGYPFHVQAYLLPNGSVCALFKHGAEMLKIEVAKETFEKARAVLARKEHGSLLAFPPTKSYTEEEARKDAALDVSKDLRFSTNKTGLDRADRSISEMQVAVQDMAKTNPWLERQLLGVADKLGKASEPLEKLLEEFRRMETEEKYSEHEQALNELPKYRTGPGQAAITEEVVDKYLRSYISAYRDTIKPDYPDTARPAFYKGYPHLVRAFILPNEGVAVTFKYNSPQFKLEVSRTSPDMVADLLKSKEHHNFLALPPLKGLRKEDAAFDAKLAVKRDIKSAYLRALLNSVMSGIGEEEKNLQDISKTNPWLEKQLAQAAAQLSGVKQLLSVLIDELEKSESGKRYGDHEQLLEQLLRFRLGREATAEEEPEEVPMAAPGPAWQVPADTAVPAAQPVYLPAAQAGAGPEAPAERYGMAPEDKQTLDMIKATLYNIDVKMDDFERRLNYIDKYVEGVQKQQLEKFNAQNEILRYEARRAKYAGIGISTGALVLVLLFLLDTYLHLFDPVRRLLFPP